MWAAVFTVFLLLLGTMVVVGGYVYIARQLPSPDDLPARSASFKSTRIFDRHGELLYEVIDPTGGKRTIVPIEQIPPHVIWATIATEDSTFYRNPGFDPFAILRALYQDLTAGEIVSGASSITQQIARSFYLTRERTFLRKVKEAVLAAEITRRYSKGEILEIYLNEFYYGNLAYGIGAAAETYFGKQVQDLTLGEAALLAGLLQSAILNDPYANPEQAKARRSVVLDLMVKDGYITPEEADQARHEPLNLRPQRIEIKAPHFVMYVREILERRYGTALLYRSGLQVYTSLDLKMQRIAERVARAHIAGLADQNATNAALVAMDPQTGEILAMLGSVDFFSETIAGQVNVALQLRQPGSTVKPIAYVAAFERHWNPATMIMDVRTEFPNGDRPPYVPVNYDRKEHGPVSVRQALACSYNIAAVQTLNAIGLPAMLEMAQRLGIRSWIRPDYGLSLVLGAGDVTLLELVEVFSVFANQGIRVSPTPILRITDYEGKVLEEASLPPAGERILDPRHAFLITSILADNEARAPAYGRQSHLLLSRPAAAKTGTTEDYRDAWVLGYTPDLVTGVWVGNSDGSPMKDLPGVRGAGPIWHSFMEEALQDREPKAFEMPPGIVSLSVCPVSGHPRTQDCPPGRVELFLEDTVPSSPCPVHTRVRICQISGSRATEFCPPDQVREVSYTVFPLAYRQWAEEHGFPQPPLDPCPIHAEGTNVQITYPSEGQTVGGLVEVQGSTLVKDFSHYILEYGLTHDPQGWGLVRAETHTLVDSGTLGVWDTRDLANGPHTLRVLVFDHQRRSVEGRVRVFVYNKQGAQVPTFPPLLSTVTPTASALYTATPSRSATPSPTGTPTYLPTSTETPSPTATPTSTILLPVESVTRPPSIPPRKMPAATPTPLVSPLPPP